MVVCKKQSTLIVFIGCAPERGFDEIKLRSANIILVSDNTRIFQRVTVERENSDEWCFDGKEYARLDLRSTRQATSIRRDVKCACFGAEFAQESRQAGGVRLWRNHSIVIAR